MCWRHPDLWLMLLLLTCGIWAQPLPQTPLLNFQVSEPPHFPETEHSCTLILVQHLFANSFGQPAIVEYEPPVDCGPPGTWAAISLNFSGTSNGRQFDRLASLYLSGVEIWRTSTPEPTTEGIEWTALKDVSKYSPLFAKPSILLLDLGNIVDDGLGLTGAYNVTIGARFFGSSAAHPHALAADIILPLSGISQTQGSVFSIPPAGYTNVTSLPTNIVQAFVEIYASGNANEEFWYGNVPDEFFSRLSEWNAPDGLANPKGPFREVQLLIDDILAGVVFPYPVIYSGEFLPSIWRPMLSYGAFDSPTYYIDVTPFVPRLCDGQSHSFTLDVVGMGANFSINSNWFVSGNLQLLVDDSEDPTTGKMTIHHAPPYVHPIVVGSVAAPNVTVSTTVNRMIEIEGHLKTGSGKIIIANWQQRLSFTNTEAYTTTLSNVSTQHVQQLSNGSSLATHNGAVIVSDLFAYPFGLNLNYSVLPSPPNQTFFDYGVTLQHSYQRMFSLGSGIGDFETKIRTVQDCEGTEFEHESNVTIRTGRTREQFSYTDGDGRSYFRDVEVATLVNLTTDFSTASNSSLIHDRQTGSLASHAGMHRV